MKGNEPFLIHYKCDVTNAIMPPMINNGKAMYISPPITIPINITGKKITVQSSFKFPRMLLTQKQKIFQQTKSYKLQIITITFFSPSETHFDMRLSFFLFFF